MTEIEEIILRNQVEILENQKVILNFLPKKSVAVFEQSKAAAAENRINDSNTTILATERFLEEHE